MFKLNSNYFILENKEKFLNQSLEDIKIVKNAKGIEYYNVPAAFDIETSSFYENDEKRAICYIWQFGINGNVIIGRSLEEFFKFIYWLSVKLNLNDNKIFLVYVHNLGFEFQFIRKWFKWNNVFSDNERTPMKAITNFGVEFRCSYRLSGYSLNSVANNLLKYKVKKLLGSLDYEKIRHSKTELTFDEMQYCINDVLIVMAYIKEEMENYENNICNIPLTNTGRVRRYCKVACKGNKNEGEKFKKYSALMKKLTLTPEIYYLLKQAFQGGFTHANAEYAGVELKNISSYDFTSSYPYVMISEKFPMSQGYSVPITAVNPNDIKSVEKYIKFQNRVLDYFCTEFCCIMVVRMSNVISKFIGDNFLSQSKCRNLINPTVDNGRIVKADDLTTTITEIDLEIYKKSYSFDLEILNLIIFEKNYLPLDFVNSIIKLYADKTELKGIEGKEVEYLRAKGMLNSCYGMSVTDIVKNENEYDSFSKEWKNNNPNVDDMIQKYNSSRNRFLFYAWGIWVTAYARYNLFQAIYKLKKDYVYSDTDSVKFKNLERNKNIFDEYNKQVEEKLKQVSKDRNIPYENFKPKNKKGIEKLIGIFEYEGTYKNFKTLGAKRYMYLDEKDVLHITVAGLSKKAAKYLIDKYGLKKVFKAFCDNMKIPADYSGRITHTYLDGKNSNGGDFEYKGIVKDYNGLISEYNEKSAIHLEKATFELSIAAEYEEFIEKYFGGMIEID